MRKKFFILLAIMVFSACAPPAAGLDGTGQSLTPYLTSTAAGVPTEAAAAIPQPTLPPVPTATPLVHVVALGETISSIALRYGLNMSAVLAANPQVNPNALTVGTEVIVPLGDNSALIGLASEVLDLAVGSPDCIPDAEGGLRCFVPVTNPLDEPAAVVTVLVSLVDASGEELSRINVPLILNKINAGQTLPAVAYFPPPIPKNLGAAASLVSALPLVNSGRTFLPASVINEQVILNGQTARVSGEIAVEGEPGTQVQLQAAALAYDAGGRLVGVRRTEIQTTLETGNAVDFNLILYSTSGDIVTVRIQAEAYQPNQ